MVRCVLLVGALAIGGTAIAGELSEEDPWTGRTRAELEQLLGEAAKVKSNADGTARLTYKLMRLDPAAEIPPGALPVSLPGVGLVVKVDARARTSPTNTTIEPIEFDEKGRPSGGGVTSSASASVTWDNKQGKKVEPSAEAHPEYRGKVRLTVEVDSEGRIVSWSVSPKKARG